MSDLFLKILNFSINASWLIVVVFILRKLLKKAPKWIFCVLWGLVAFRLICPFTIKSILSLLPSSEVVPQNITLVQRPVINTGIAIINNTVNPVISGTFAPEPASSVNPLQVVTAIAAAVWVAGMAAMALYLLTSYIKLKRKVRMSIPVGDNIRTCDEIKTPFILGLFQPVIYVPSSVNGKALEFVISHEKAHLQRRDHWWKPLGFALLTVYWFNPLCWLAYILLCRDIEAACDEKVIREKNKDYIADYSQTLLDLSVPGKMISACPLAFGETGVKSRVKGVLNYKKPAFWLMLVAVLSCIAAGVCFLTDPVSAEDPELAADATSIVEPASEDPARLPEEMVVKMDHAGVYYYSGNVVDGKTIIDFSITLEPDGTFTYYETPYSSFIGTGKYVIEDGILTLMNDEEMTGNTDVNRFRIEGDKLYFIEEGSANFHAARLDDGAEFVYGVNPIAGWMEQPLPGQTVYYEDAGSAGRQDSWPDGLDPGSYRFSDEDIDLENGWSVDSVTVTPKMIKLICYREYFWPGDGQKHNCCYVSGLILTDGTRVDGYSTGGWRYEMPDWVRYEQTCILSQAIDPDSIKAICISVFGPQTGVLSEKELTFQFEELTEQPLSEDEILVRDDDKITAVVTDFGYYPAAHAYILRLQITNKTDELLNVISPAVSLNDCLCPCTFYLLLEPGQETTAYLSISDEDVRAAGIDPLETTEINLSIDLQTDPPESFENLGEDLASAEEDLASALEKIDAAAAEEVDVREAFLSWLFTSNQDDRLKDYELEELLLSTQQYVNENPPAEPGIAELSPEIMELQEEAVARYYSPIAGFTSEELIQKMIANRTPMNADRMYVDGEAEMKFVDVTFSEGREDPFVSGMIYDFDVRVTVDGYEHLQNFSYTLGEDGYFHITGQISVEDGIITNYYVAGSKIIVG